MKRQFILMAAFTALVLSGCTTYKASMLEATANPVKQKLPNMDLTWDYKGKAVQDWSTVGVPAEYTQIIVRNEITRNVLSAAGQKKGALMVRCEDLNMHMSMAAPFFSGFTLFSLNLLGVPMTSAKIDMTLAFDVMDVNGDVIDTYRYSVKNRKAVMGFYYGTGPYAALTQVVKEITKQLRDDIDKKSPQLIAQLNEAAAPAPVIYYAQDAPVKKQAPVRKSDVDVNIPLSHQVNQDTYVLIIANEEYMFVDNVNYALRDGETFKEYCIKTLGVPEQQIRYYPNATFGIIKGGVDWLSYALNNFDNSKGIVYYCGHGIPDEKTGQAYLIPTDGKGTSTSTCYSLNTLYQTLGATKAANVTYFMDACFTGANKEGSMLVAARGVAREAKREIITGNTVVFSASSGDETAMTYADKQHGLFTYYLLKKLQESEGNVSYEELANYISRHVRRDAFLLNEKPQTPVVATSSNAAESWKTMTLK